MTSTRTCLAAALVVVAALASAGTGAASAAIKLPTVSKEIARQKQFQAIAIPAPPCPESGLLPQIPGSPVALSNCGLPETPATTLPFLGPMVYWGATSRPSRRSTSSSGAGARTARSHQGRAAGR